MASIEDCILSAIKTKGRGSIFFPSDFTSYGEVKAIGKSLERQTAKDYFQPFKKQQQNIQGSLY